MVKEREKKGREERERVRERERGPDKLTENNKKMIPVFNLKNNS